MLLTDFYNIPIFSTKNRIIVHLEHKDRMSKKSCNQNEADSLQGEGGSDVFTTTRHINYNQPQQVLNFTYSTV